CARIGGSYW
nr:immunoglobulin heavy chain junction region [Mus musculus]MBK4195908.1 immunoglobulin heavy chain junction region [Mus musculus]MBK4195909.1 immunoglobulin heavy chain junction region [Mus musculus]MBK4195912.1 immunoglobulin heavy chain junction region [Mus musculus]